MPEENSGNFISLCEMSDTLKELKTALNKLNEQWTQHAGR